MGGDRNTEEGKSYFEPNITEKSLNTKKLGIKSLGENESCKWQRKEDKHNIYKLSKTL